LKFLDRLLGRAPRPGAGHEPLRPAHGAASITDTIDRALASAGLDTQAGPAAAVRATIDRAFAQAGLTAAHGEAVVERPTADRAAPMPADAGTFASRSFTSEAGSRDYKLYVPGGYDAAGAPMPLIVMLHGCTQSPDDFATGTRMNALAEAQGFLVAYPAQAARANGSRCWNWFRAEDQAHGRGEPALIAGIARQVAADYRVDPRRIFVAGLSAGAAMAVILGERYPDVFAAVGAHSGLPFGAAHDVASAFSAMQGGTTARNRHARSGAAVPTIVFHGDADHTVAASNGEAIIRDATGSTQALHATTRRDAAAGGRAFTRDSFADASGRTHVEHWRLHGAGHAWSGGSAQGSYTDPTGPDASSEMLRFFLQHPVAPRQA
jgi:poly(hydroxyalkanoate) depolymerase family esterase